MAYFYNFMLYVRLCIYLCNTKLNIHITHRYQMMLSCWKMKNSDRPTFSILVEQIDQHYSDVQESDTSDSSSLYHNLFNKSI